MMTCCRWVELKTTGQIVKEYSVCLSSFTWKEPSLRDYTGNRLEDWRGGGDKSKPPVSPSRTIDDLSDSLRQPLLPTVFPWFQKGLGKVQDTHVCLPPGVP